LPGKGFFPANRPVAQFIHRHFFYTPKICNLILLFISMLYSLLKRKNRLPDGITKSR